MAEKGGAFSHRKPWFLDLSDSFQSLSYPFPPAANGWKAKVLQSIQDRYEPESDPVGHPFGLKELQELIGKAATLLPSQRQKIFKMSRDQGLSRQEIAEQLNISENTVKNQLRLSLKFVQEFIGKTNGCYIPFPFTATGNTASIETQSEFFFACQEYREGAQ